MKLTLFEKGLGSRIRLATAGVAMSFMATASLADEMLLRWAELGPPTGVRSEVVTWMAEEIEARTEGRIKIEMHWGSSLVKRREMLRGVMIGTADIGTVNVSYHPAQLRTWGIFNTFMRGPSDPTTVTNLKRAAFDTVPTFREELEPWNQSYLTFFNYLPSAIALTEPFTTTAELENKRIRAPSQWLLAMLEAADATPVSMPWGEVYVALQRGTVDGVLTSLDSYYRYSMDEVAQNYLYHREIWQPQPILITINNDTWSKIASGDQQIILKIGNEANAMENKLNETFWEESMQGMVDRSGAVFTEMSAEDLAAWESSEGVQALPERWISDAEAAGYENARDIMGRVKELIHESLEGEAS